MLIEPVPSEGSVSFSRQVVSNARDAVADNDDVDDGSSLGILDHGVTNDDLLYDLNHFQNGCCAGAGDQKPQPDSNSGR